MLSKLIGNDDIKHTLRRLIAGKRVPNSLLFAGEDGVGKRQFALEIVKAFICLEPTEDGACDVCAACTRTDKLVIPEGDGRVKEDFEKVFFSEHLDVGMVVPFKRHILVKAIRDLERNANFRPYEAAERFFIVDDANKMNDESSNALLKILEEPPSTSFIFLITSRPDSMLATIRSRCQTLRFAPVETAKIEQYLISQRAFSRDEARLSASLSRGSIGRAVSMNVKQFCEQRNRMFAVLQSVIKTSDIAALLAISEQMNDAKNKDRFEENLSILESLIHDVWSLKIGGDRSRVVNADLKEDLESLARSSGSSDLPSWMHKITALRDNLSVNINRKIAADALFVSMTGL